jgi:hypothetical protein
MRSSSQITTLFTEHPPPKRGPSSFAVSIFVHCVAIVWIYLGFKHVPQVNDQSLVRRFTVRLLRQENIPEPTPKRAADTNAAPRSPRTSAAPETASNATPGGTPEPQSAIAPPLSEVINHAQTLIQPDVPPDLTLIQEVPVPTVVRWSPENDPVKAIVLPPKVLSSSDIKASLTVPNRVPVPAEIKMSATAFSTPMPMLEPGTPSPVVVRRTEPEKRLPESASQNSDTSTPARIISLSDLRAKDESIIPAANASPPAAVSESTAAAPSSNTGSGGAGNPASTQNGSGTGKAPAASAAKPDSGSGSLAQNGVAVGTPHGSPDGLLGSAPEPTITHISVPKDGQFGVVVVGSSLTERYPEIATVWGSRLIYTVYLHVGTRKSWILQYSMPRSADAVAAGSNVRPDAPWPYDISRPNLAPDDSNSDAIMVHGFVNLAGTFEKLAIVFPTDFAQTKFVLNALQQWKFRAARQGGQLAAVEILLIIPQETE